MSKKKRYEVSAEQKIMANKNQVWSFLMEFDDVFKWAPGVTKSHAIGKDAMGVGHGRHCYIKGFGGIDEFITEFRAEHSFAYSVSPVGPFNNARSSWSISEIAPNETRLNIQISYELRFGILGNIMHSLMARKKIEQGVAETASAAKSAIEQRLKTESDIAVAAA